MKRMFATMFATLPLASAQAQMVRNEALKMLHPDFAGNRMVSGSFQNLFPASQPRKLIEVLRHKLTHTNPYEAQKREQTHTMPIVLHSKGIACQEDFICWLGHATFLIQIGGRCIVTDPCLSAPPLTKRHTPVPLPMQAIKPDYLLISHGHFDHLDAWTVKHFDDAHALVPLGMEGIIRGMNPTISVQEAGWFQRYEITEDFEVVFLPSHHWHRRSVCDTNRVLWGSFLIKTPHRTLYFAGDTAYSPHFKEIGRHFDIDIAMLPIGAYEPRAIMKQMHMSPEDALRAYADLGAEVLIPMHYGTFDLTDEPMGLPPKELMRLRRNERVREVMIGEVYRI